MNKKSIIALMALIVLAVLLLAGLPFTATRIIEDRMEEIVTETATPPPVFDNFEG